MKKRKDIIILILLFVVLAAVLFFVKGVMPKTSELKTLKNNFSSAESQYKKSKREQQALSDELKKQQKLKTDAQEKLEEAKKAYEKILKDKNLENLKKLTKEEYLLAINEELKKSGFGILKTEDINEELSDNGTYTVTFSIPNSLASKEGDIFVGYRLVYDETYTEEQKNLYNSLVDKSGFFPKYNKDNKTIYYKTKKDDPFNVNDKINPLEVFGLENKIRTLSENLKNNNQLYITSIESSEIIEKDYDAMEEGENKKPPVYVTTDQSNPTVYLKTRSLYVKTEFKIKLKFVMMEKMDK